MRYISIFSGIEAASVAWEPLGWEPVAFSEIDEFPSAVLRARYPNIPNLGDITKVDWSPYRGTVDIVVGGSPCQSFSIAGKREGLAGASGLMWEYIRCIQDVMPEWLVWENVPGALSSERGWAFEQLLAALDGLGYGLAWRILDAQFFGVAQRRRRVFLVGHLGDMRATEVLFEPESMRWDTPSSKQKREALAADARSRTSGAGRGLAFAQNQRDEVRLIGGDGQIAGTVPAQTWGTHKNETLVSFSIPSAAIGAPNSGTNAQMAVEELAPTIKADGKAHAVAEPSDCLTPWDVQSKRVFNEDGCGPTLQAGSGHNIQPIVMASDHSHAEICVDGLSPTLIAHAEKSAPILVGSTNTNAAIDFDLSPTLHVRGGAPVIAAER